MAPSNHVFGPYRLLRQLHDCDVGEALLAKRVGPDGFEKPVVIRRIRLDENRSSNAAATVASEANAAAMLSHSNISHVLDLGALGTWRFVATEYVDGCTVQDVLRGRGPLPWTLAAHIVGEAARALSYAHGRRGPAGELLRIVHRRCSPSRIALSSAGDIKVTGFGTSWAWAERDAYRSPERRREEPVDGRADVFALGVILTRSMSTEDAPPAIRQAIERATRSFPEHRSTADELHEALSEALHASADKVYPRDVAALSERVLDRHPALRSA